MDKFTSSGHFVAAINLAGAFVTGVAVDHGKRKSLYCTRRGESPFTAHRVLSSSNVATNAFPTDVAVDSSENVYVVRQKAKRACIPPEHLSRHLTPMLPTGLPWIPRMTTSTSMKATRCLEFDSSGIPVGSPFGSGYISKSVGLAADDGSLYVSNPGAGTVAVFGRGGHPP